MSAWRLSLRLARRSMRRHLGRSVLIAALIAVPIAGATVMSGLLRTITGPERAAYQAMGTADGAVQVTGNASIEGWQPGGLVEFGEPAESGAPARDPASVDLARLLPAGTRVVPDTVFGLVRLTEGDRIVRTSVDLLPVGDPLAEHQARLVSGRLPAGPAEALVTEPLAVRLGLLEGDGVRPGATITPAGGSAVTVTGLAVNPGSTDRPAVVAPPDSVFAGVPGVLDGADPTVRYLVDLPPGTDADALWPRLAEQGVALTPRAVYTEPGRYPSTYPADDVLETVGPIALVVGFGLLEVVLLAGAAFAVGARRQVRELGLIAANGGTAKHVGRTVLAEGLTLGVVGAAGGLLLGAVAIYAGWPLWERFTGELIESWRFGVVELVAAGLVAASSGLGAALLPAIGVARMRPVDALAQRFRTTRRSTRLPVLGLVALGVGVAGVLGSAVLARQEVAAFEAAGGDAFAEPDLSLPTTGILAAGLVAITGLIMLTSGLVSLLARFGGRLPLPGRLALRDAGRHRHRTVPAVAAIMIVVTGSVTLAFAYSSIAAGEEKSVPDDTLLVLADAGVVHGADAAQAAAARRELSDGTREMAGKLPDGTALDVPVAMQDSSQVLLAPKTANSCTAGLVGIADPALLELTLERRPAAGLRSALDRGSVVALDECFVADGTTAVESTSTAELPAVYEPRPAGTGYYFLPSGFVSAQTAKEQGWTVAVDTVAVRYSPSATQDDIDAAIATAEDHGLDVWRPDDPAEEIGLLNLALAAAAGLVTLLGVGVTIALSAAESRADLATLAAIGAPPRRRRTLAGTQALVLSGLGTVLGLVLGGVLGFATSTLTTNAAFTVPWSNLAVTAVVVPVLAVAVAMVSTRSKLPMVRRVE